jgi:hypothetical protein
MKRKQKNIACTLLCVLIGISAIPLFLPDAAPVAPDKEIRLVQFEEADECGERGVLRSVTESFEENNRLNDLTDISFIQNFHLASFRTQLANSIEEANARRSLEYIYLRHSSLII